MKDAHARPDQPLVWHARPAVEAIEALASSLHGLDTKEARRRLERFGPNRLPQAKGRGPLIRFLRQFHNLLVYVLLASAVVTLFLGHLADTSVIIGVVLVNAIIGFIQEGKAERSLEAIRNLLSHSATVLRDGQRLTVPAEELVPGDLVVLQSGDKVPADLRLVRVRSLQTEEAALTGESVPVEKTADPVPADAVVPDRRCIAFSGTLVTYGQATGVVVGTGADTEIGRISTLLAHVPTLETPLLRQVGRFGQWLTLWIGVLAVFTLGTGVLLRGYTLEEMFLAAVGLAVAAIPEGLPAIITITLAIGVQRMARRNAIVRSLPAVETLGSVSVICTDKTGTLTRNEMTVTTVVTARLQFEVSGVGYDPHGGFSVNGADAIPEEHPTLIELCRAALLCNDAVINVQDDRLHVHGDPTEAALITLARKAGLEQALAYEEFPRTDVIPFESEHRFMATLHHDHAGHGFILLKGAPERVLDMCSLERIGGDVLPIERAYWHEHVDALAAHGQRLLAVAFQPVDDSYRELRFDDVAFGLTLLGLVGLIDPPRQEAVDAVATCQRAGIRVKMITGDHAVTARAIGKQMGIGDGVHALTGTALEAMDDDALRKAVKETDVFARASPEHKLRLVEALQAEGAVVAMTGDGVNDAPALRRADVGVAMGMGGTEVAKEAAEMVLADDNFASIAHAVEEGRTVYDNIRKSILFILPTNGGEAFTISGAILFGFTLPLTPVQILWVNMITAVTLALSLAFEPTEHATMQRPPRDPREPLLSGFIGWRILFVSLVLVAGTLGLFLWERAEGTPLDEARTIAVNTLVVFEAFYLFNSRYMFDPVLNRAGLLGNRFVLGTVVLVMVFQIVFTYAPPMQQLFHTTDIDLDAWGRVMLVGSTVLFAVEAEKWLLRRWRDMARRRRRRAGSG